MNLEEIEKLISEYEVKGKELEPNRETRNMMMESVSEYSEQFLDAVHNKKAFINDFANDGSFDNFPFEETPTSTNKVINFLKDNVDNAGINPASGGHIGYIPGGGIYSAALGDYLAAVMNRYAGYSTLPLEPLE